MSSQWSVQKSRVNGDQFPLDICLCACPGPWCQAAVLHSQLKFEWHQSVHNLESEYNRRTRKLANNANSFCFVNTIASKYSWKSLKSELCSPSSAPGWIISCPTTILRFNLLGFLLPHNTLPPHFWPSKVLMLEYFPSVKLFCKNDKLGKHRPWGNIPLWSTNEDMTLL